MRQMKRLRIKKFVNKEVKKMKKLKIGLIGIGGICNGVHIPAYLQDERTEVVALCDIVPEKTAKAKKEFFPNAKEYTDFRELLKDDSIDAVDICTPNYLHSIIAVEALERGKHVFCEKPDAVSVGEVQRMKAAAEKSGKVLMVMRNNRFMHISKLAKQFVEEGRMGEIYAGRCGWIRRRGIPGKGGWFTTKEMSGGGPLIDLGVHMIDLAIWLMGNPTPVAVSGATYRKFADSDISDSPNSKFGETKEGGTFDVEDLAMGFIRFDNGAVLQIEFSWASNIEKETRFVELRGTEAGLSLDPEKLRLFYEKDGKLINKTFKKVIGKGKDGHAGNIENFVDVVLGQAEPVFVPQQGVDMIKILTAIYESAEKGREVVLK